VWPHPTDGMVLGMAVQIAVRLPDEDLERLDAAVARGSYPSRAAAVRAGLQRLLRDERETQIAEAYRQGYAAEPADPEIGEAGLELGTTLLAEAEGSQPAA
jgi:Arc/MetJ-type ribon-helix-helix transcriptional regulator